MKDKELHKIDVFVIGACIYLILFSLAFFIAWCLLGVEPSTLEACILAPGVIELMCTTYIKTHSPEEDHERKLDENH